MNMEGKVVGVLAALSLGNRVRLEGPPQGDIAGLATEGVVDCDICNNGGAVWPEEMDVSMLVGVGVRREMGTREGRGG